MSTPNDNKRQQLISKLKELFQLDQPDLDFGLYRIKHAKSAEITQFLEKDLLPQVQSTFALYKTADKAEIEKELAKVIAGIEAAGMGPSQSPKAKELQAKLQSEAVDVVKLEGEVYDHHLATPPGARPALIGSLGLRVDPRLATPCPLRAQRRSAALRRCCLRM